MKRLRVIVSNRSAPINQDLASHLSGAVDLIDIEDCSEGYDVVLMGDLDHNEDGSDLPSLADQVQRQLHDDFSLVREAMRHGQRGSRIYFMVQPHRLAYNGMPARPILTEARLSMMRSLAKEAMVFGISVNAISYVYGADESECRRMRRELRHYGPRIPLMTRNELFKSIENMLLNTASPSTGEVISLSAGVPHSF